MRVVVASLLFLGACTPSPPPFDGGVVISPVDGGTMDAGVDGGVDDGTDAGTTPLGCNGLDEPVFDPQSDVDVLALNGQDGTLDSYTSTANLRSDWEAGGTSSGMAERVPGRNGSSGALRLTWPAAAFTEVAAYFGTGLFRPSTGNVDGRQTHLVVRYWFRTNPGADFTSGRAGSSGIKWLLFRRDPNAGDPNGRITWGVNSLMQVGNGAASAQLGSGDDGVSFTGNDQGEANGRGLVQNVTREVGWSTPLRTRTRSVNDGQWHCVTYEADTATGLMRAWADGVKVLDSGGVLSMPAQGFQSVDWGQNVVPDVLTTFWVEIDDVQIFGR